MESVPVPFIVIPIALILLGCGAGFAVYYWRRRRALKRVSMPVISRVNIANAPVGRTGTTRSGYYPTHPNASSSSHDLPLVSHPRPSQHPPFTNGSLAAVGASGTLQSRIPGRWSFEPRTIIPHHRIESSCVFPAIVHHRCTSRCHDSIPCSLLTLISQEPSDARMSRLAVNARISIVSAIPLRPRHDSAVPPEFSNVLSTSQQCYM